MQVELATLCKGLAKLVVVDIALTRDQDKSSAYFREHELRLARS